MNAKRIICLISFFFKELWTYWHKQIYSSTGIDFSIFLPFLPLDDSSNCWIDENPKQHRTHSAESSKQIKKKKMRKTKQNEMVVYITSAYMNLK